MQAYNGTYEPPETENKPSRGMLRLVAPPTISRYEALLQEPAWWRFGIVEDRVPYLCVVRAQNELPKPTGPAEP